MDIFTRVEKTAKKMRWYEFSILKLDVFFFTLFLITAWEGFRQAVYSLPWHWYLLISVILMIPLLKKMYSA